MKNYLIGIGIDKYATISPELSNAVRDTKEICDVLHSKYGFEKPSYLFDSGATNEKVHDVFKALHDQVTEEDSLLIYYAGHGDIDDKMGIGYWILHDAQLDKIPTYFPNSTLIDYVKRFKAKHIILISDSCFSRTILLDADNKTSYRSIYDYEKQISRWAITSGRKPVPDGPKGGHSPFAESIIEFLNEQSKDFLISDLIQNLKKISYNSDQNPQGSPIANVGHGGGEYIFKPQLVKRKKRTILDDELKGYSDVSKILQLSQPQAQFNEDKSFEDKSQKIGYSLFMRNNKLVKQVEYYLYLYKGIIQTATLNYLKSKCSEIFKSKNFIILIPREEEQKNQEVRKRNIQDKFKPTSIYYIDEFIWEYCTPKGFTNKTESKLLDINNFVKPRVLNENKEEIGFEDLTNWLSAPNEQVLVLKGNGGIGKTTVAKYIADFFQLGRDNVQKQKKSLFIESSEIIDELKRTQNTEQELNIYSFYEADFSKNGDFQDKLNDVLFKVNLDNGNLLVIIDGLDEIISKVPNFDVNVFLNSIFGSYNEIGNAKVIITCRNHFWDSSKIEEDFQLKVVELLPFDEPQAKKFFDKSFNNTTKRTEKCIKIAKEFISKTTDIQNIDFQPYVLDIIKNIVESDGDIMIEDASFDSRYLIRDNKSDYIIYNVCRREIKRIEQIPVDEQIKIFLALSVKYDGLIAESKFSELINNNSQLVDKSKIEALKSHPFITTSKNNCIFRYDFLVDIFKGIYLKSILDANNAEQITEDTIQLISNNCSLNSNLTREVVNRIKQLTDEEIFRIIEIINAIQELDVKSNVKIKAVSGLFAIALRFTHTKRGNSIESNTDLLNNLFASNNSIQNLCIIDFSSYENTIKFDFSDKTLNDCHIENYSDFWSCKFNEKTLFKDCKLYSLHNESDQEIEIKESQFQNCTKDSSINEVFKNSDLKEKNIEAKIQSFLDSFFGIFLSKGRLEKQSYDDNIKHNIKVRYAGIRPQLFKLEKLIKLLEHNNIITDYIDETHRDRKLKISDDYKMDITKFCKEGTISSKMNKIIKLLAKNLN
ncbi:MAG: caspase family protein [Tannerella sp.]|jgi:hypothetical protein|nr:caspase family protein [Tannerella sp.]